MSEGTIIIAGAASGIGAATASMAAQKGFAVCVNFLANAQGAEQVASDINKDGGKAIAIAADVRDDAAVKALFDKAEDALGSVRVNGVRPGFIATDMHAKGGEPGRVARLAPNIPMRRGGEPHEVASAIVWLLSDEASFTTGAFIDIGGGI